MLETSLQFLTQLNELYSYLRWQTACCHSCRDCACRLVDSLKSFVCSKRNLYNRTDFIFCRSFGSVRFVFPQMSSTGDTCNQNTNDRRNDIGNHKHTLRLCFLQTRPVWFCTRGSVACTSICVEEIQHTCIMTVNENRDRRNYAWNVKLNHLCMLLQINAGFIFMLSRQVIFQQKLYFSWLRNSAVCFWKQKADVTNKVPGRKVSALFLELACIRTCVKSARQSSPQTWEPTSLSTPMNVLKATRTRTMLQSSCFKKLFLK